MVWQRWLSQPPSCVCRGLGLGLSIPFSGLFHVFSTQGDSVAKWQSIFSPYAHFCTFFFISLLPPHPSIGALHLTNVPDTIRVLGTDPASQQDEVDDILAGRTEHVQNPKRAAQRPVVHDRGRALPLERCPVPKHCCLLTHHKTCHISLSFEVLLVSLP